MSKQVEDEASVKLAEQLADMELAKMQSQPDEAPLMLPEERQAMARFGAISAYNNVHNFTNLSMLTQLQQVKARKEYRMIEEIGTWESYCKRIGMTPQHANACLDNLKRLGSQFLQKTENVLTFHELRSLSGAVKDGRIAITDNTIKMEVIEGEYEEILLDDKEGLKDALERMVIASSGIIAEQQKELQAKADALDAAYKREKEMEKSLDKTKSELKKIRGGGEINGMPKEDYGAFVHMEEIINTIFDAFADLEQLTEDGEKLSLTNRAYLSGVIRAALERAVAVHEKAEECGLGNFDLPPSDEYETNDDTIIPGMNNAKGHKSSKE